MSTEKFNLILKLYPEEIQISAKKRAIYYHLSEANLPKGMREKTNIGRLQTGFFKYYSDKDGWIVDVDTDEKVVRNSKTAGKPNMQRINGQSIWNGTIDTYARNNLKKFLSEYFGPAIVRTLPETLFCAPNSYFHFEFIFYVPLQARAFTVQDLDNHAYPYIKSFMDTLTLLKVIPDDNAKYFRGSYSRYVDCVTEEDRRLEIKVHICTNTERIQ